MASVLAAACAHQVRAVDVLPTAAAPTLEVRLDDLPAGFREAPMLTPADPSSTQARTLRACFGGRPRPRRDPQARVHQFSDASGRTLLSYVGVRTTEAEARELIAHYSDLARLRCAARALIGSAAAGEPVVHLLPFHGLGDGVAAWRTVVEVRATGRQVYLDEVVVRFGRLLATCVFNSGARVFTPVEERRVVLRVVERGDA